MKERCSHKEFSRLAVIVRRKQVRLPVLMVISLGLLFAGDYQRVPVIEQSPVVKQHDCISEATPPSAPVQEAVENPAPEQAAAEEVVVIVCREDESYDDIIEKAAVRYDVDVALVKAIIMAESGYNPRAVSSRGAMGLMQLMPRTAEALGVEDGFNPEQNIDAGVRYFRSLMNAFNEQTRLALAAYNAGPRKVREYSGVPPFSATRVYIEKVFQYYRYFKDSRGGATENA